MRESLMASTVLEELKAVDTNSEKHKVRGLLPDESQKNYDTNP